MNNYKFECATLLIAFLEPFSRQIPFLFSLSPREQSAPLMFSTGAALAAFITGRFFLRVLDPSHHQGTRKRAFSLLSTPSREIRKLISSTLVSVLGFFSYSKIHTLVRERVSRLAPPN
jgi:hypothetical protein